MVDDRCEHDDGEITRVRRLRVRDDLSEGVEAVVAPLQVVPCTLAFRHPTGQIPQNMVADRDGLAAESDEAAERAHEVPDTAAFDPRLLPALAQELSAKTLRKRRNPTGGRKHRPAAEEAERLHGLVRGANSP